MVVRGGRLLATLGVALTLFVLSRSAPEATIANSGLPVNDQVPIYAAVIREVARLVDSQGNPVPRQGTVFLVRATNDAAGNAHGPGSRGLPLSLEVQDGISRALSGLPSTAEWVDYYDDVEWTDGGVSVIGGGQIVEVGTVVVIGDDEVHVPASTIYGNLGAFGTTYVLRRVQDGWSIIGNTGTMWMSHRGDLTSASS